MKNFPFKKSIYGIEGFSLIETIIVLSVIAILSSAIFPIGTELLNKANKQIDANRIRQLIISYSSEIAENGTTSLGEINSIKDFAAKLAKAGGINNTSCYKNYTYKKSLPIIDPGGTDLNHLDDSDWNVVYPINFICQNAPVVFSKTLNIDATKQKNAGIIGLLNGEIIYIKAGSDINLSSVTGKKVNSIKAAIPENSHVY